MKAQLASLFLAVLCAACAVSPPKSSAEELVAYDQEWGETAAQGTDVERIVSFWADDAVAIPPGVTPMHGKVAIRSHIQRSLETSGYKVQWHPISGSTSPDGQLGYTFGVGEVTFRGSKGALETRPFRYTTIWRKNERGEWKCVLDTWNYQAQH